uniref:DUF834 domain-containing protein n=1 Tax=Oryza meyeriana var. granulata TaxID=110450 RepID=A0A1V1H7A8_9ORYZ|nr:hypothetical protein [Oryza meyeriana var. granulata]
MALPLVRRPTGGAQQADEDATGVASDGSDEPKEGGFSPNAHRRWGSKTTAAKQRRRQTGAGSAVKPTKRERRRRLEEDGSSTATLDGDTRDDATTTSGFPIRGVEGGKEDGELGTTGWMLTGDEDRRRRPRRQQAEEDGGGYEDAHREETTATTAWGLPATAGVGGDSDGGR